jgi:hypothetical protein
MYSLARLATRYRTLGDPLPWQTGIDTLTSSGRNLPVWYRYAFDVPLGELQWFESSAALQP